MTMMNRIFVSLFFVIGIVLFLTISCEKDETTTKKDTVITWSNPEDIIIGTLLSETQLNAIADVPGTFDYMPPIGTILNEGENQDLKVDFTPEDIRTYNSSSKTVQINVTNRPIFNSNLTYSTVSDIDDNSYKAIAIGTQTFMAENLNVTRYNNGDFIETTNPATLSIYEESTPKYQWPYDGNESKVITYGRLYTWYVATDSRNVCPAGWHIPSEAEWTTLTDYLTNNGFGYQDSDSDIAKSMAASSGWNSSSNAGTIGNDQASNNSSGFTALPGGVRGEYGQFQNIGNSCIWWSASEYNSGSASAFGLANSSRDMFNFSANKVTGYSIRCLKD